VAYLRRRPFSPARNGARALFGLLTTCAVVTGVGPHHAIAADVDGDEPERLIRIGNDLRRKGDNLRAFGYLQRAYDISRTPRAAAQLGLCEQALGRFGEAEVHLGNALSSRDAWVDASRSTLEAARTAARKHLGKVHVLAAPAGTTVAVGELPPQKLASDANLWIAPGPTTLAFDAEGYRPSQKSVSVAIGAEVTIESGLVSLSPVSTTPPKAPSSFSAATPPPPTGAKSAAVPPPAVPPVTKSETETATESGDSGRVWRITGLAVGGAGAAMIVGGVVLRQMASKKFDAIQSDAHADRPYDTGNGNFATLDGAAIALWVAGGAALVGGATLYFINRDSSDENDHGSPHAARTGARAGSASLWPTFSLAPTASAGATAGVLGFF